MHVIQFLHFFFTFIHITIRCYFDSHYKHAARFFSHLHNQGGNHVSFVLINGGHLFISLW